MTSQSHSRRRVVQQKHVATSHEHHHHIDNISSNASAIIKEKMHSMMDVMDTRIEGVEGIMSNLQRTVHKLNKKVIFSLKTNYSKICFVRSLVFSTENGHKRQVTRERRGKIDMKSKELPKR